MAPVRSRRLQLQVKGSKQPQSPQTKETLIINFYIYIKYQRFANKSLIIIKRNVFKKDNVVFRFWSYKNAVLYSNFVSKSPSKSLKTFDSPSSTVIFFDHDPKVSLPKTLQNFIPSDILSFETCM